MLEAQFFLQFFLLKSQPGETKELQMFAASSKVKG